MLIIAYASGVLFPEHWKGSLHLTLNSIATDPGIWNRESEGIIKQSYSDTGLTTLVVR